MISCSTLLKTSEAHTVKKLASILLLYTAGEKSSLFLNISVSECTVGCDKLLRVSYNTTVQKFEDTCKS